jgi:hypothetical protein
MKRLLVLALTACALPAWGADVTVGVGVAAKSDDSTIYVPIDFGDRFRLEPLLRHSKSKLDIGPSDAKYEAVRLGLGAFGMTALAESVRIYYGGRLSYLDVDSENPGYTYPDLREHGHGYRIAPTFGFEYMFNKYLSLGGEAEWFYEDLDLGINERNSGTDTRLILRLRF